MNGPEFYQTQMGRRYYENTLPRNTEAMNRLATAIEENTLTSEEVNKLVTAIDRLTDVIERSTK